jgi:hypothetical protein
VPLARGIRRVTILLEEFGNRRRLLARCHGDPRTDCCRCTRSRSRCWGASQILSSRRRPHPRRRRCPSVRRSSRRPRCRTHPSLRQVRWHPTPTRRRVPTTGSTRLHSDPDRSLRPSPLRRSRKMPCPRRRSRAPGARTSLRQRADRRGAVHHHAIAGEDRAV